MTRFSVLDELLPIHELVQAATLSGSGSFLTGTWGVASLNPRLLSGTPPAFGGRGQPGQTHCPISRKKSAGFVRGVTIQFKLLVQVTKFVNVIQFEVAKL